MAKVFISGSWTGLGLMTGRLLVEQGHQVVLHGRSAARSRDAHHQLPQALEVVTGDLSTVRGAREVAEQVNRLGRFDAVIHNAGIGYREPDRIETEDGVPEVFATNVLAPFVLTGLIARPGRLVYLSSGMHHGAVAHVDDLAWTSRRWSGPPPMPRASCMTCFWLSPPPAFGPAYSPTLWSRAGCLLAWVDPAPRTIWTRRIAPRHGSPSAMTPRPG
jgi:NAD(P)-dependent dehydrogenase (short-subunit alcohol dehydrogenase family)